jgi:hypothetical protein
MKPATAKSKGRETENLLVAWLIARTGLPVERRRLAGTNDKGDLTGIPDFCGEVKSGAAIDLPGWLRQLDVEMINSNASMGAVFVRPKSKPNVEDWYVVLPIHLWAELFELWRHER